MGTIPKDLILRIKQHSKKEISLKIKILQISYETYLNERSPSPLYLLGIVFKVKYYHMGYTIREERSCMHGNGVS
jgi:hypothetical protein